MWPEGINENLKGDVWQSRLEPIVSSETLQGFTNRRIILTDIFLIYLVSEEM